MINKRRRGEEGAHCSMHEQARSSRAHARPLGLFEAKALLPIVRIINGRGQHHAPRIIFCECLSEGHPGALEAKGDAS